LAFLAHASGGLGSSCADNETVTLSLRSLGSGRGDEGPSVGEALREKPQGDRQPKTLVSTLTATGVLGKAEASGTCPGRASPGTPPSPLSPPPPSPFSPSNGATADTLCVGR